MSVSVRRPRHALPLLAAGAALAVSVAVTTASASARGVVSVPTAHLDLIEHANTDTEIPVAPGGKDEKGDPLTFTNPVFNAGDTHQVGHDEGFCMRLNPARGIWECSWTTFLPGGSIMVQGPFYDTRSSTLAIIGGTGRYSTTRGSMFLQAFDHSKRYHFDFDLQQG